MKQLIIIGAGGMGRVMYDMARESHGYQTQYIIKGYIDDNIHSLDSFEGYPPMLGTIADYQPQLNDVFICSIGGNSRRACMESIINRGGEFLTLIHQTARIGSNVQMGKGCMIGAFTTVAADAKIGDYNFIQSNMIIGHDVVIGDWNRIDSHTMLIGGIKIGNGNMIHSAAVINHDVIIGDNAHVGACSFVTRNVEDNWTVFGNPARRLA
ncbi:MAG: NeuD/PglB/VioB family sugar acetyltransferase [Paludibacteraceae bacterium]|jgi:sugar O-acyltransferase (sialic acid O-acetyltransferase NeuD family)|nr:NeuD/PglB/VioB family sugar acetyltransferase [Paludibacteraceae bacterium]